MAETWTPIDDPTAFQDDAVFEIDEKTKSIQVLIEQPIVAGENKSQFIKFQMGRYYDAIDLTQMEVNILYESPTGYQDISAAVNREYSDEYIRFGWLVPYAACPVKGTLGFAVEFVGADYVLKTTRGETPVLDSISGSSSVPEPTEQTWYIELQSQVAAAIDNANSTLESVREYIDTFQGNIDDAIDNWFDAHPEATTTVQDGAITEAKLADSLKLKKASFYNTVAEMKADANLSVGTKAVTLGFYSAGEGGAIYKISESGTANERNIISLSNGLFAVLAEGTPTVKQLGAHGDGATDDSAILQAIFDDYETVVFDPDSVFVCSSTLTIYGKHLVRFNNSQIITSANVGIIVQTYQTTQDHWAERVYLYNLNIKGNGTNTLLQFTKASKVTLRDSTFWDFNVGIYCQSGYGLVIQNLRMEILNQNNITATGIITESGDSTYSDIVMRDCHIGMDIRNGRNYINRFHPWIYNSDVFPNSICVYDKTGVGANNVFNDLYADSFHHAIQKTGGGQLLIKGLIALQLEKIITDTGIANGYLVYYEGDYSKFNNKVVIEDYLSQYINPTYYIITNRTDIITPISVNGTYYTNAPNFNTLNNITLNCIENVSVSAGSVTADKNNLYFNCTLYVNTDLSSSTRVATIPNTINMHDISCSVLAIVATGLEAKSIRFLNQGIYVSAKGRYLLQLTVPYTVSVS